MAVIVRPMPVCVVAWPDTCVCGDSLQPGEVRCEHCTSLGEHEQRMAEIDDAIGEALAQAPCCLCQRPCADREPPSIAGVTVCPECWSYSLGVE